MSTTAPKPATTPIPVQLSAPEFEAFILPHLSPHLSMPSVGPSANWALTASLTSSCGVLYTGMQWKCLPVPHDAQGKPAIHSTTIYKVFARWADDGSLWQAFVAVCGISRQRSSSISPCCMATGPTPWPKKGRGIGYSGHKHQKGDKVIAIIDHHGYVLAPVPVAPVNETDMVLLPEGLKALKEVAKEIGLDLRGAYLNLDGGFDQPAVPFQCGADSEHQRESAQSQDHQARKEALVQRRDPCVTDGSSGPLRGRTNSSGLATI